MLSVTQAAPAWFGGDRFRARVALRGTVPLKLLWATAQLHGHVVSRSPCVSNAIREAQDVPHAEPSSATALPSMTRRHGLCVFSSAPCVLWCDVTLGAGEAVAVQFEVSLPQGLLPTLKGRLARHAYFLTVACATSTSREAQFVNVPVVVLLGVPAIVEHHIAFEDELCGGEQRARELSLCADVGAVTDEPVRVELRVGCPPGFVCDEAVTEVTPGDHDAPAPPSELDGDTPIVVLTAPPSRWTTYHVGAEAGHIFDVRLNTTTLLPGDVVVGVLDFTGSVLECVRASVALEMVESSTGPSGPETCTTVVASCTMPASHLLRTLFELQLPQESPPSFVSPHACVSWRLRLLFDVDGLPTGAPQVEVALHVCPQAIVTAGAPWTLSPLVWEALVVDGDTA